MSQTWNIVSPDAQLQVTISLTADGALAYQIQYGTESVICPSTLGVDIRPGGLFCQGLKVLADTNVRHDVKFPILSGKCSQGHDLCNELLLDVQETDGQGRKLRWHFRAYNDGFALRYSIPLQKGMEIAEVVAERTMFAFAENHRCWAEDLPHFQSSFESEFHARKLSELKPGALIGCPLTLHSESGLGIAITEAGLHDFAGMYLEALPGNPSAIVSRLAPLHDGSYASVRSQEPLHSPWRVIQIAHSPAKLIESNIIYCLNEPCAITNTSWIRPGKVTWDWWSGHAPSGAVQQPGMNNATMMDFIDFAAEMKLEYFLLDGGWYQEGDPTTAVPAIDLPKLIAYANAKGVDVLVWNHQADLRRQPDKAFAYYESLNIKGVKVDFFDRDDQDMVQWARDVVLAGAAHHLLVDLHGIFKPTGFGRTYPNLMTHEGVMGAEYNKWSARITPEHNVTIPFTRMLAGPMDYTPGGFDNATADQFRPRGTAPMVMGTRCHNLAMYVVYESPLQMISDYPDAIRNQAGSEFLKVVPSSWDQTLALCGEIGQYVAIARRKGRDWFLGAMTNSEKRTIEIDLSFLGEGAYDGKLFVDSSNSAADPKSLLIRNVQAASDTKLTAELAPAGGMAGWFRRR